MSIFFKKWGEGRGWVDDGREVVKGSVIRLEAFHF